MHKSVLADEVVHYLSNKVNGIIVDCTLGSGGHTERLLEAVHGKCTVIGIDRDAGALERSKKKLETFKNNVTYKKSNFVLLDTVLEEMGIPTVDGFIFDLGVSSNQLMEPERGFSFIHSGPLDMRMDTESDLTAYTVVNQYPEQELVRILREYGEERRARKIASRIVTIRKKAVISTTQELADIIKSAYGGGKYSRIHPATRTFQALRIEVNGELQAIDTALDKAVKHLAPEGVICAISFHSLEDRIVKWKFRKWSTEGCAVILTKKPIYPSEDEIASNPRARSAKLRIAKRSLNE